MKVFADPVVDWGALGKVIVASLGAGVGVTLAVSLAIVGAIRFADMRRSERPIQASLYGILGLFSVAVTIAAVVVGIVLMAQKG